MIAKVVKRGVKDRLIPGSHVTVTHRPARGFPGEGFHIEITPANPEGEYVVVQLPEDGEAIYFMELGQTVDSYRWPPKTGRQK